MKQQNDIFRSVQLLTDFTKRMALEHDFATVANCMQLAGKLYEKGNDLYRAAIENIFVFSFSSMLYSCNTPEWHIVQSQMPPSLHDAFIAQVLRSKC